MASLRDILERGLHDYLDDKFEPRPSNDTPTPEQTPPKATEPAGVEPTLLARVNRGIMSLTQDQILTATLVAVGVLAVVHFATRK